jgi:hypothetical protein
MERRGGWRDNDGAGEVVAGGLVVTCWRGDIEDAGETDGPEEFAGAGTL